MTFATITQVKEELNLSTSITTNDSELNDLLTTIDNYINTRLSNYTSLPLQSELQTYLADLEARWVVARFRLRRATPQEQQQYQAVLTLIETQYQQFLKSNFQQTFTNIGSRSEDDSSLGVDLGQWNESNR